MHPEANLAPASNVERDAAFVRWPTAKAQSRRTTLPPNALRSPTTHRSVCQRPTRLGHAGAARGIRAAARHRAGLLGSERRLARSVASRPAAPMATKTSLQCSTPMRQWQPGEERRPCLAKASPMEGLPRTAQRNRPAVGRAPFVLGRNPRHDRPSARNNSALCVRCREALPVLGWLAHWSASQRRAGGRMRSVCSLGSRVLGIVTAHSNRRSPVFLPTSPH